MTQNNETRKNLVVRVTEISLDEKTEQKKRKRVRISLRVEKQDLLSGTYAIEVPLKIADRFKINRKYFATLDVEVSPDFPRDNPKTMRIATQNYDIFEVRNIRGEVIYSR